MSIQRTGTQHYELVGLPAYLKLDQTDNLLNPTHRLSRAAQRHAGAYLLRPAPDLCTNLISGSTYWALAPEQRAVLAGKLALGSLDGAPLSQLPADQRIYAGGGGSIRPYGYQLAGPLAPGNKPIGGRSSLVLNLEARIKITETIGIVPFVDAGSYYESPVPQLGRTLLYGVGLGSALLHRVRAVAARSGDAAAQAQRRLADPGLYQPRAGLLMHMRRKIPSLARRLRSVCWSLSFVAVFALLADANRQGLGWHERSRRPMSDPDFTVAIEGLNGIRAVPHDGRTHRHRRPRRHLSHLARCWPRHLGSGACWPGRRISGR